MSAEKVELRTERLLRDLEVFQDRLSGLAVRLVVLAPSPTTLETRKPVAYRRWSHLQWDMLSELEGIGLWVDSSDLSVEETIDRVKSEQHSATAISKPDVEGNNGP